MAGQTKSAVRGMQAERRFEEIAVSLTGTLPIVAVRHASRALDSRGVDFIITLTVSSSENIRVPVQVKSSEWGVQKYQAKYKHYEYHRIIIIVVNSHRTNVDIVNELCTALKNILNTGMRYDVFFAMLDGASQSLVERRKNKRVGRKTPVRRKNWKGNTLHLIPQF